MIGTYVMTQHDRLEIRTKIDSIGLGSYGIDSHHAQRIIQDNNAINEGIISFSRKKKNVYLISIIYFY